MLLVPHDCSQRSSSWYRKAWPVLLLLLCTCPEIAFNAFEEDTSKLEDESTSGGWKQGRLEPQQLYQSQELLKQYEWEWVLVKIDQILNLPLESLGTDLPDPEVSIVVDGALPTDIDFSSPLNTFIWPAKWNSPQNTTEWEQIGLAAYLQNTAESIDVTIVDKNNVDQDYLLLHQSIQLPQSDTDVWSTVTLQQNEVTVRLSIMRVTRPLYTENDHFEMRLQEYLLPLENGELASLVYRTSASNKKAVLYFAGRSDSFAHPHVLDLYVQKGYDFYALDPRRSGRARRFLKNPYLGNDVHDMKELFEDVDMALQYIRNQKEDNYDLIVAHCHSNGALVAFSYLLEKSKIVMKQLERDFDGFVLNSPFLDWSSVAVGGALNEMVLKNAGYLTPLAAPSNAIIYSHPGLNDWWTKVWLLYRWNLAWKPVLTNSLTLHWAKATSRLHRTLETLSEPLLKQPTLVLSSKSDDILEHAETLLKASRYIHASPQVAEFDLQCHDVTKSYTHELNDEAMHVIADWLDDLETYHSVD